MFARVLSAAALSAIGMASVLAFTPIPAGAAGHGNQDEVKFQAYVAECNKMDHSSQAYRNCMALAEGQ
jgi:hypothetical protein